MTLCIQIDFQSLQIASFSNLIWCFFVLDLATFSVCLFAEAKLISLIVLIAYPKWTLDPTAICIYGWEFWLPGGAVFFQNEPLHTEEVGDQEKKLL